MRLPKIQTADNVPFFMAPLEFVVTLEDLAKAIDYRQSVGGDEVSSRADCFNALKDMYTNFGRFSYNLEHFNQHIDDYMYRAGLLFPELSTEPVKLIYATELEIEGLLGIAKSEFQGHAITTANSAEFIERAVWTHSANVFAKPLTFSGVMYSLTKKGLANSSPDQKDAAGKVEANTACCAITAAGWDVLIAAGKVKIG